MFVCEKIKIVLMLSLFFLSNISSSSFLKKTISFSQLDLTLSEGERELEKEIYKSKVLEAFCFLNSDGRVFDLNPLYNETNDYIEEDGNYTMYFNFCRDAHMQCEKKNTTALAIVKDKEGNCHSLGGSNNTLSKWNVISKI